MAIKAAFAKERTNEEGADTSRRRPLPRSRFQRKFAYFAELTSSVVTGVILISTRRLSARPSAVLLSATG